MGSAVQLGFPLSTWVRVSKGDARALALADRHYSRQTPGSNQFVPPGRSIVLLTPCARAVWAAVQNLDPAGKVRWRVTIFRNEGAGLSSALARDATTTTLDLWRKRYGELPGVRLTTEIDPGKVRRKRDPGRCFLRAGWTYLYTTNGSKHGRSDLVVLGAPNG